MDTTRAPVKYKVLEKSLIGNEIYEAGATAEYAGLPAENLKPLCDEGRKRYQEYKDSNAARVRDMLSANPDSAVGNAEVFGAAVAKAVREALAQQAPVARGKKAEESLT